MFQRLPLHSLAFGTFCAVLTFLEKKTLGSFFVLHLNLGHKLNFGCEGMSPGVSSCSSYSPSTSFPTVYNEIFARQRSSLDEMSYTTVHGQKFAGASHHTNCGLSKNCCIKLKEHACIECLCMPGMENSGHGKLVWVQVIWTTFLLAIIKDFNHISKQLYNWLIKRSDCTQPSMTWVAYLCCMLL